ncbi:MAG: penicillin-binding protein 2 [Candidatus Omnitrophica bacterium]|nr:penicillin-binding protein 2 [Candidatus Omnitrophota bacterium]
MRIRILRNIIVLIFFILAADVFWMQLIHGPDYVKRSENNRIRLVPEDASRGIIYDRNKIPLVENKLAFDVVAIPQEMDKENKDVLFSRLGKFLDIGAEVLADTFSSNYDSSFSPVMLASNVPRQTAFLIEQEMNQLQGIFIKTSSMRNYIYKEAAAHISGYIGKMRESEYPELEKYGYLIKDVIGRAGLEKSFDKILRGKPGGMQLEVNSKGSIINVLSYRPPMPGEDLYTTIDINLQQLIHKEFNGEKGAACVMDCENGEILALYSGPSFDPNLLIDKKKYNAIGRILKDPDTPLFNRALNVYPPGSIFKIVTAYAALKNGVIDSKSSFECTGEFKLGNSTRNCWMKSGHGRISLREALATSCNVFFWNVGLKMGAKKISSTAREFGLGKMSGIELPGERAGVVPGPKWKRAELREKWYGGDTANFSIGQGYLLISPLQALKLAGVFASGGLEVTPHIIKQSLKQNQKRIADSQYINIIQEGMFDVVHSGTGTGRNAFIPGAKIFAKTGTAQVGRGDPHAWFMGYALIGKRNICFVVFLEQGGHGGERPAQITRSIISYFKQKS